MPWRCPACQTEVRHNVTAGPPRTGDAYRCHVCHLDLCFDSLRNQMTIAPVETDHEVRAKSSLIVPPTPKHPA
jgi:hypothetical protein